MERVQRIATESKVAQAEIELVHLKSRQVEMEESYLVAIELMKKKADHTLKTWMESDSIRDDEIQELLDLLPEEYQPAIRKDFSPRPIVRRQGQDLRKGLPEKGSDVQTMEETPLL